jgi:hypothetical protein
METKYYEGFEWTDEDGITFQITKEWNLDGKVDYEYMRKGANWNQMKYRATEELLDRILEDIPKIIAIREAEDKIFNGEEIPFVYELTLRNNPYKSKTWIAKITGNDEKFKFQRTFLKAAVSHTGKRGDDIFRIKESGYYQFESDGVNGFFRLRNGIRKDIDELTIIKDIERGF